VKNYSIVGLHWGLYLQRNHAVAEDAHAVLTRWAQEGRLRPVVSERVPFAGAAAALTRLATGGTTGRVVVGPAGG
jgi:NADPH2:quinone reductase